MNTKNLIALNILLMTTNKKIHHTADEEGSEFDHVCHLTVLLGDILGMASVEFGGSTRSENCLVVHLAVASS